VDRGVFGLEVADHPEEKRWYEIRFPIHHESTIRAESARHRLDPAWVAAEIRAESIFNPRARSSANARGLMQVLPSTGAAVAKRNGIAYGGAESLYDSDTNIAIGTAYLRQMEDKYGRTYLAIAAYNAGPSPVARWQSQRPGMDPDFWIETISYKETRDYVARVLAFSVIYDWRMNGDALPVSQRLLGEEGGVRKKFACPAPEAPKGCDASLLPEGSRQDRASSGHGHLPRRRRGARPVAGHRARRQRLRRGRRNPRVDARRGLQSGGPRFPRVPAPGDERGVRAGPHRAQVRPRAPRLRGRQRSVGDAGGGPGPARLHRQRDRPRCRRQPRRSLRRRARRPGAGAAPRRPGLRRGSAAGAARGPLHGALRRAGLRGRAGD